MSERWFISRKPFFTTLCACLPIYLLGRVLSEKAAEAMKVAVAVMEQKNPSLKTVSSSLENKAEGVRKRSYNAKVSAAFPTPIFDFPGLVIFGHLQVQQLVLSRKKEPVCLVLLLLLQTVGSLE